MMLKQRFDLPTLLLWGARFALGALMIWGGLHKFEPQPTAQEALQRIMEVSQKHPDKSSLMLYIYGMKQSGFAWQLLGLAELIGGVLLCLQGTALLGSAVLLPITLHIFLFHLFLEPDEPGEVLMSGLYFLANLLLIGVHYKQWKHLLWIKPWKSANEKQEVKV